MSERIMWEINQSYGIDDQYRFRYGERGEKVLLPFQPIGDRELCLGVIDNSILKPVRMMLFDKDRKDIKLTIPATGDTVVWGLAGKSALVIVSPDVCDREFLKDLVLTHFGRSSASGRYMHVASVAEVESAGWVPYWAPLQLEGLKDHVRLVAKRTIFNYEDPTINDAESLVAVLKKV